MRPSVDAITPHDDRMSGRYAVDAFETCAFVVAPVVEDQFRKSVLIGRGSHASVGENAFDLRSEQDHSVDHAVVQGL